MTIEQSLLTYRGNFVSTQKKRITAHGASKARRSALSLSPIVGVRVLVAAAIEALTIYGYKKKLKKLTRAINSLSCSRVDKFNSKFVRCEYYKL